MKLHDHHDTYTITDEAGGQTELVAVRGDDLVYKRSKQPLTDGRPIEQLCARSAGAAS